MSSSNGHFSENILLDLLPSAAWLIGGGVVSSAASMSTAKGKLGNYVSLN